MILDSNKNIILFKFDYCKYNEIFSKKNISIYIVIDQQRILKISKFEKFINKEVFFFPNNFCIFFSENNIMDSNLTRL